MEAKKQRKITRNREYRACTECRKRKLRCDRQLPCISCAKRGEETTCYYEKNPEALHTEYTRRLQAETKLQHLEQLVQELSRTKSTQGNQIERVDGSDGVSPNSSNDHTSVLYNGETHWSAMLQDIEELRIAIGADDILGENENCQYVEETDIGGILFGATQTLSFHQVLEQSLPLRQEADRLVAAYFRTKTVAAPYIHTVQFGRQYEKFWPNPQAASPLWTSMLFSIFHVAQKVLLWNTAPRNYNQGTETHFAIAAAHCLAIGRYFHPQPFVIEALLLYLQSTCITSIEICPNVAMQISTTVRLATTMGYHRDPDKAQERLTVFEGEMRRRTWSMLMQLDTLISFQLGLPCNVQYPTWDTRPPTNLLDSDFDEDTIKLPAARSDNEPTELRFYIAKHRLMAVFEKIIRHALSTVERPESELNALDEELQIVYMSLPAVFNPRSLSQSIVDPASIIITRLCVEFIYQKCLCVLHRKHVASRSASFVACHNAAANLVSRFLDVYSAFEPGGQLASERWFLGNLTWNDFMMGCTALCFALCMDHLYPYEKTFFSRSEVIVLLGKVQRVFSEQFIRTKATQQVSRLIAAVLQRTERQTSSSMNNTPSTGSQDSSDTTWNLNSIVTPGSWANEDWPDLESFPPWADCPEWTGFEHFLDLPSGGPMMV
ncbi:hypothetical protein MMC25_001262 [Agyrium rufum]|nr:hypothetical protein [Agyrium rufum]